MCRCCRRGNIPDAASHPMLCAAGFYPHEWDQPTWDLAVATNFEAAVLLIEQLHHHLAEGERCRRQGDSD